MKVTHSLFGNYYVAKVMPKAVRPKLVLNIEGIDIIVPSEYICLFILKRFFPYLYNLVVYDQPYIHKKSHKNTKLINATVYD